MVERDINDEEGIKFCPLLTVVRAGQANYMACQTTCVFFIDDECAFITAAKALKRTSKGNSPIQEEKK